MTAALFWPSLAVLAAVLVTAAAHPSPWPYLAAGWVAAVGLWGGAWLIKRQAIIAQGTVAAAVVLAMQIVWQAAGGASRPGGFMVGPNLAAVVLAIALVWGVATWARPWGWVLAAVLLPALLLTGSRSGVLAAAVGVAGVLVLAGQWRWAAVGLVVGGAAVGLVTATRPELATLSQDTGVFYRWDFWRVAWLGFAERPWLGHGPGNYPLLWLRWGHGETFRAAHNLWLHIAAEQGLVGLVAWGWLAAEGARWAWGTAAPGVVGVLIVFAVHCCFDTPEWFVMALVAALVAAFDGRAHPVVH